MVGQMGIQLARSRLHPVQASRIVPMPWSRKARHPATEVFAQQRRADSCLSLTVLGYRRR
jgi:hypothetical protein